MRPCRVFLVVFLDVYEAGKKLELCRGLSYIYIIEIAQKFRLLTLKASPGPKAS